MKIVDNFEESFKSAVQNILSTVRSVTSIEAKKEAVSDDIRSLQDEVAKLNRKVLAYERYISQNSGNGLNLNRESSIHQSSSSNVLDNFQLYTRDNQSNSNISRESSVSSASNSTQMRRRSWQIT